MKEAEIKDRVPALIKFGLLGRKTGQDTKAVRFKEGNRQLYRGNDYTTFERDLERGGLTSELSGSAGWRNKWNSIFRDTDTGNREAGDDIPSRWGGKSWSRFMRKVRGGKNLSNLLISCHKNKEIK